MPALFDLERTASREDVAAVLRRLAAGVESGGVTLENGDPVTVDVPGDLSYELDLETVTADTPGGEPEAASEAWEAPPDADGGEVDAGDGGEEGSGGDGVAVELEVELEWEAGPRFDVAVPTVADDDGAEEHNTPAPDADRAETTIERPPWAAPPVSTDPDEQSADAGSAARFELFADRADEWRWRLRHDNGNVIADSGEGYTRKANARKGLASVRVNAPGAPVLDESKGE